MKLFVEVSADPVANQVSNLAVPAGLHVLPSGGPEEERFQAKIPPLETNAALSLNSSSN